MSDAHSSELRAAVVATICAAAKGPTPSTDAAAMHAWLGAGSDAMLAALQHYGTEGGDFGGAFDLFAACSDTDRRAMLRALADALAAQGSAS
jgi:hypothetical protein